MPFERPPTRGNEGGWGRDTWGKAQERNGNPWPTNEPGKKVAYA